MTMESDGICVPVLIKRFLLVEEAADLMDIPAIVQAVALVKVITNVAKYFQF